MLQHTCSRTVLRSDEYLHTPGVLVLIYTFYIFKKEKEKEKLVSGWRLMTTPPVLRHQFTLLSFSKRRRRRRSCSSIKVIQSFINMFQPLYTRTPSLHFLHFRKGEGEGEVGRPMFTTFITFQLLTFLLISTCSSYYRYIKERRIRLHPNIVLVSLPPVAFIRVHSNRTGVG